MGKLAISHKRPQDARGPSRQQRFPNYSDVVMSRSKKQLAGIGAEAAVTTFGFVICDESSQTHVTSHTRITTTCPYLA